jgi:hypothetical protein
MPCRQVAVVLLTLCGALALTGCTAGANNAPSVMPSSASSTTDEVTCLAFADVLTVVANADAGIRDGRLEVQEQDGWYRLATRVLDRVPSSGDGAVSDAVAALQEVAPAIRLGASRATGIGSVQWDTADRALAEACADAGVEMAVEMFTGG